MKLTAITGGIGSGKSVIARMVHVMGYPVYDCDSRAKQLMTENPTVRQQLEEAFGKDTYCDDGTLNRDHLSAVAFKDHEALKRLNAIIHPATARDMQQWALNQASSGAQVAFVETALLRTAGLDHIVDDVWHVTAPEAVRIERVMIRSRLTARQVLDRMAAQKAEDVVADGEKVIVNDNVMALLPQVTDLLCQYNTTNQY